MSTNRDRLILLSFEDYFLKAQALNFKQKIFWRLNHQQYNLLARGSLQLARLSLKLPAQPRPR
jgi:hypothetical protein